MDIEQKVKEIEEMANDYSGYEYCDGKRFASTEALKVINHLQSEVERCKSLDKWRPIETCPEDQYVFVWVKSVENLEYGKRIEVCKTKNHSTGWAGVGDLDYYNLEKGIIYFSHWRPLPKPPKQSH